MTPLFHRLILHSALLFLGVPAAAGAPFKEADILGTWHNTESNMVAIEVTYTADHQYTMTLVGIVAGKMTGPWRIDDGQIVRTWTGGEITSVVDRKKTPPDNSEQREKIIKLAGNTLTARDSTGSGASHYKRGGMGLGKVDLDKYPLSFPITPQEKYDAAASALSAASTPRERLEALGEAAKQSFEHGDIKESRTHAEELLKLAAKFRGKSGYADAIQDGNLVLGRLAVHDGQMDAAKAHLLASGKSPGATASSFGPNMNLAKDLLEKGQRDAVLEYFALCRKFWPKGPLDAWTAEVQRGETPDFGANLAY